MPNKRPNEPIGPTNIPGQPLDPKIPLHQRPEADDRELDESDDERQARESEKAFDRAITRTPPG